MLVVVRVSAYVRMAKFALQQGLGEEVAGSAPANQANIDDVTDLDKAHPMIAQSRRAVVQHTELAVDYDFLPQQRQRRAVPRMDR